MKKLSVDEIKKALSDLENELHEKADSIENETISKRITEQAMGFTGQFKELIIFNI